MTNEWAIIIGGTMQAVTAIFVFLNTRATNAARKAAEGAQAQSTENHALVLQTQKDVRTVEIATNSMKDRLVALSASEGVLRGRAEMTAEAAAEKAKEV